MPQAAKTARQRDAKANQYRQRTQAMYNDRRWRKARAQFLKLNPYCAKCRPVLTKATHLDHKIPHHGDYEKFWDVENWQGLCMSHHNQKTRLEQG